MKNILILNGSTRRGGRTDGLTYAFANGAKEANNEVQEVFTNDLNFGGKLLSVDMDIDELGYRLNDILTTKGPVGDFYRAVNKADVLVLASPIYWWNITGNLKNAIDYIQPLQQAIGWQHFNKETALLLVAGGNEYQNPINWYHEFERFGFKNDGIVAGQNKEDEAFHLGKEI